MTHALVVLSVIIYAATMSLGILAATTSLRFGRLHHVAFFLTCATTIIATVVSTSWLLIGTLSCLAAMPFCPSRTMRHRVVGIIGLVLALLAALR